MNEKGELSFENQVKVANYNSNFIGLSKSANASRGHLYYLEWNLYKRENSLNYESQRYILEMVNTQCIKNY